MVWNTIPDIQIFVTSKFDEIDITNSNVKISGRLPNDYILKRLVPIHPRNPFNDKRCIVTKSAKTSPATIIDTYLILIPIAIRNSDKLKRVFEYFGADDLMYINDLVRQIGLEENDERASLIRKINHSPVLDNDDIDSSISSLPTSRKFSIEANILSSDQRISTWISNSILE
jgi:hypothetical protein